MWLKLSDPKKARAGTEQREHRDSEQRPERGQGKETWSVFPQAHPPLGLLFEDLGLPKNLEAARDDLRKLSQKKKRKERIVSGPLSSVVISVQLPNW